MPIIATEVGGNPEAIENGVQGYLVPYGDPEAIAEKILRFISDDGLRAAMAERAKKRFNVEFTAETMIRKTAEWLQMCYERHSNNPCI